MPKSEFVATFEQIDKAWRQALEHEKSNRLTADQSHQRLWQKSEGDIRQIMAEMGGLKQQQVGTASAVDRIEGKIDKMQGSVNALAHRVRASPASIHSDEALKPTAFQGTPALLPITAPRDNGSGEIEPRHTEVAAAGL